MAIFPITHASPGIIPYKKEVSGVDDNGNETICMINALKEEYRKAIESTPEQLGLLTNIIGHRENRLFS